MEITKIETQKKRADYGSIFVDGKFSFSLPIIEISKLGLRVGDRLDNNKLVELKNLSSANKAIASCLRLISYRIRSEWEMNDYLKRKNYEPDIINQTTAWLKTNGYINDLEFTKNWVNNRIQYKHASLIRIKSELRAKHIDSLLISKVIDETKPNEVDSIKQIILKKRSQTRYRDDLKLKQYLSRQGFSYDKIKEAFSKPD